MARRSLTTGSIVRAGLTIAPVVTTADGDVIDAGNTILIVENIGAAPATVTVQATAAQDGLDVEDQITTIATGAIRLLGPWPARTFGQPSGAVESGGDDAGRVYVNYSTPADLAAQVATI
jgi:hypothetical protein